jgi:hypothetical protein
MKQRFGRRWLRRGSVTLCGRNAIWQGSDAGMAKLNIPAGLARNIVSRRFDDATADTDGMADRTRGTHLGNHRSLRLV